VLNLSDSKRKIPSKHLQPTCSPEPGNINIAAERGKIHAANRYAVLFPLQWSQHVYPVSLRVNKRLLIKLYYETVGNKVDNN
jgi:hypothetical protein